MHKYDKFAVTMPEQLGRLWHNVEFDKLDTWYYKREEEHYSFVEKFVRQHIDDFIIKT